MTVYPAASSESSFYEDDGESLDYRDGAYARRRFAQKRDGARTVVDVGATEGSWRPPARDLVLRLRADRVPARVLLDRSPLGPRGSTTNEGWRVSDDGYVEIVLKDRREAFSITLEEDAQPARRP